MTRFESAPSVDVPGRQRVAEGADRFRHPGGIERLRERLRRLPIRGGLRQRLKALYHVVLGLQTKGRGLASTLPGGETVRVLPEYGDVSWNPDEYRAFRAAVRPGMIALDVGANVGAYSMVLGQWVGSSGRVFAFEPSPSIFDGLERHIRLNHLEHIVTPVRAAIGDAATNGAFLVAGTTGESRLAASTDRDQETVPVEVTTIDEFCARGGIVPDFIKIDVEGAELAALRGARETIRSRRGALALFVEMHPSIWRTTGISAADLIEELRVQELEPVALVPSDDIWGIEGVCVRLVPR